MITNAQQATRPLAIFTPLGDDRLLLRRFQGREELSRLFRYDLELLSADDAVPGAEIIGRNVTLMVRSEQGPPRFFNAMVRDFCHAQHTELGTTYQATVVPWLWLLTQTADCRIFQDRTVPEIIERIFRDLGFRDYDLSRLDGPYAPREYCVQYRESDFDFVSRLMEEEGIFYFFRHENGAHTLCLADRTTGYFDLPDGRVELGAPDARGDVREQLLGWEHRYQYRSGKWTQTDFRFQTPRRKLMTRQDSIVQRVNNRVFEIYDYPGRYEEAERGDRLTRVRMEEREVDCDTVCGQATYRSFAPGGTFRVLSHTTQAEVGQRYVLTAVEHTASVNETYKAGAADEELTFRASFAAIPADVAYRPPRRTPKPVIQGPQTAAVVGPRGEQIYPDQYGRVKVQFHWDREGRRDENSSCWIRVSQIHAGKGWGAIDLPRIGEEVIVGFLEGDPDRPIIKGRVYNGSNPPPFGLPGQMTRSGGKSNTHQGSGYNEITADDTADAEQIRVNAQHDMDTTIGNNQTLEVAVDSSTDIGNNDTLSVAVDAEQDVGNDRATMVGNNMDMTVGNHIVIEAGTSITLACGASTIHMNQAGVITISGTFVSSIAKANHCIVAPLAEIVGANMLVQAGAVVLDLGGIVHVKGAQTSLNAATIDIDGGETLLIGTPLELGEVGAPLALLANGLPITQNPDGSISVGNAIRIVGDEALQQNVLQDLGKIGLTDSGKALLTSLDESGMQVTIHDLAGQSGPWAWSDPVPSGNPPHPGYLPPVGDGTPTNAQVGIDPNFAGVQWHPNYANAEWASAQNMPSDVVLFHELVHADDLVHGRMDPNNATTGPHAGTNNAELRAVGLPPYHEETYSENSYREERGLPARTYY